MPIYPRGTALPQDLHDLTRALGFGPDEDELAIVIPGNYKPRELMQQWAARLQVLRISVAIEEEV
jgi:hypothetical protein